MAAFAAPARAQTNFTTTAQHAFLIDADTRSVLLEKAADEPVSPASLVKVMTAELIFRELKAGRLKLDDTFIISENAWRNGGAAAGGSTMFAKVNDRIRIEDLLRGLIVQSGNDAAIALAEGVAGSEDAFAQMMNRRAKELGLRDTSFANAWGKFDPKQKASARDLANLAIHVIKTYPEYYKYFGEKEFTWNKVRQLNRNPLVHMDLGADGLKTGNIGDSGFGLIGSAVKDDQRLVLVLLGQKSARERAEESRKIISWGFRAFDAINVFKPGEVVGTASVFGGDVSAAPLVSDLPIRVLTPRGSNERLTGRIEYIGPLVAPLRKGQTVARLKVYRGKTVALDAPLQTQTDIGVGSFSSRAWDAAKEGAVGLFRTYVLKARRSDG